MFCKSCGVNVPEDSVFCTNCGSRLGGNAAVEGLLPMQTSPKKAARQSNAFSGETEKGDSFRKSLYKWSLYLPYLNSHLTLIYFISICAFEILGSNPEFSEIIYSVFGLIWFIFSIVISIVSIILLLSSKKEDIFLLIANIFNIILLLLFVVISLVYDVIVDV